MVVVAREEHVDARLLDRIEREVLPADRALLFAGHLECEERMVRDEDTE